MGYGAGYGADQKDGRKLLEDDLLLQKAVLAGMAPYSSISHTKGAGAFALSDCPVGIDLELRHRPLSDKALHRISDLRERALVQDPIMLWVIKEAAWKSLRGPRQPPTISSIEIRQLTKRRTGRGYKFSFNIKNHNNLQRDGLGLVLFRSRFIFGIAVIPAQL